MKKAMILTTTVLFALAMALPAFSGEGSEGKKSKRKKGNSFRGKITAIDAAKGSVTLEKGKKDDKESKTFQIPKDAKIKVNKEKSSLSAAQVGMNGTVSFEEDGKTIKSFSASEPKKRAKGEHKKKKKAKKKKSEDEDE